MTPTPTTHPWTAPIGVIGRGYVGSAVADGFAAVAPVRFHDPAVDGSTPLDALISGSALLFLCLPTPRGPDGDADLSAIDAVLPVLDAAGFRGPVVLKSTVPPGTTARLAARWPTLDLLCAPEFLRERHHLEDFAAPHRLVLGVPPSTSDAAVRAVAALFAARFPDTPVHRMTSTEAELTKYAANAFFAVKVSFANEVAELADCLAVSWDVVRAGLAADPRIGADHLSVPGPDGAPGWGGSCLPKDVSALLLAAERAGAPLPVLSAAAEANRGRRNP